MLLLYPICFELSCFHCHLFLGKFWFSFWFLQWYVGYSEVFFRDQEVLTRCWQVQFLVRVYMEPTSCSGLIWLSSVLVLEREWERGSSAFFSFVLVESLSRVWLFATPWTAAWQASQSFNTSVQFSCSVVSDSLWPHAPQHARAPCPWPTPGVHPNPWSLSWWCHPTISSSVVPFLVE